MKTRSLLFLLALSLALLGPLSVSPTARAARAQPYLVTGEVLRVRGDLLTLRLDGGGGSVTFRLIERGGPGAASIAPGTRVQLLVLASPEGPPVILRLVVLGGPRAGGLPPEAEAGAFQGVVLDQRNGVLSVLGEHNILYSVLVTGTTLMAGRADLPRAAVVRVVGTRNSDGSVSARSVTVLFDPRGALRVTGRIAQPWPQGGFALADGTVVTVREDTWIVRGNSLRPPSALAPGILVIVLGTGSPRYLTARVIEISL